MVNQTLTKKALGFLDEAERVRCPWCNTPILAFLVGIIRLTCRVCKWQGIVMKNDVSLVQSHTTLAEGREEKKGWWKDNETDPMSFQRRARP